MTQITLPITREMYQTIQSRAGKVGISMKEICRQLRHGMSLHLGPDEVHGDPLPRRHRSMTKDQSDVIADLCRKGQTGKAMRIRRLSSVAFEMFKRDLLVRFAAEGRFSE
jgi:hypothetical protein